jgi:hypothetical protein
MNYGMYFEFSFSSTSTCTLKSESSVVPGMSYQYQILWRIECILGHVLVLSVATVPPKNYLEPIILLRTNNALISVPPT